MITYINYEAGSTKGDIKTGEVFNNPFKLGDVDPNYTSNAVVETAVAGAAYVPAWNPVCKGVFRTIERDSGVVEEYDPMGTYTDTEKAREIKPYDVKVVSETGGVTTVTFVNFEDGADGKAQVPASAMVGDHIRVAYKYDNVVVPQNDLPMLKAEMKSIPLIAKARRIAVNYLYAA